MIAGLLSRVMDWALAKNGDGGYEGEDSPRWAYTITGPDGDPYLSRLLLPRVRLLGREFRPMLHHFHRPDADRVLHNHPWTWAVSLVLAGSYVEERLEALVYGIETRETRLVRWFNRLTDQDYHRVERLNGDVWTLFVTGKRTQDWGFLEDGRHVQWQEYLSRKVH